MPAPNATSGSPVLVDPPTSHPPAALSPSAQLSAAPPALAASPYAAELEAAVKARGSGLPSLDSSPAVSWP